MAGGAQPCARHLSASETTGHLSAVPKQPWGTCALARPNVRQDTQPGSRTWVNLPSPVPSKRVWADDFPAVALEEFVVFVGVDRAALRKILKQAAASGRGVEKQRAGGVAAGVLPGMRDAK